MVVHMTKIYVDTLSNTIVIANYPVGVYTYFVLLIDM